MNQTEVGFLVVGGFENGSSNLECIALLALASSVLLLVLATIGLSAVGVLMLACGAH